MASNPTVARVHPAAEIAGAVEAFERRVGGALDDAGLRHQLAVLLINLHGWTPEAQLARGAREHLKSAIESRPQYAPSHAALGYLCDLNGDLEGALVCFREAHRLAPDERVYEVYFFRMLAASGREAEALAAIETAAARQGVDLDTLRHDLQKARFEVNASALCQGFMHAPNFMKSSLEQEGGRILEIFKPGRARSEAAAERKRCRADQQELERDFDAAQVPESIRGLAAWASGYGLGDDICRAYLLRRLSKKQRALLIRDMERHAPAIQAWLDSFDVGAMPREAAAYMYLMLGVEEIRT
jgi:tetratricopeptide (TPR) repeat protein